MFSRIVSFDSDYKREEMEFRKVGYLYDAYRKDRHKLLAGDAYLLQTNVERMIAWVTDLIFKQQLDIVSIQPKDIDDYADILAALTDSRSLQNNQIIKQDDCYLTPDFLESFDFQMPARQREFLKARVKYAAVKLGFNVDMMGMVVKNGK